MISYLPSIAFHNEEEKKKQEEKKQVFIASANFFLSPSCDGWLQCMHKFVLGEERE